MLARARARLDPAVYMLPARRAPAHSRCLPHLTPRNFMIKYSAKKTKTMKTMR